jgi:predicted nucleotidyltransferase
MNEGDIIRHCSRQTGFPFLVIGGHAVIYYGYARNTGDLDLLVRRKDTAIWKTAISELGYSLYCEHQNFLQFTPPTHSPPIDLMLVHEQTFDGLFALSKEASLYGTKARVPSLEHLIALKLHVLKQGLAHRTLSDLNDVIYLVNMNKLDIGSEKWKLLFAKYGNLDLYEKVLRATIER